MKALKCVCEYCGLLVLKKKSQIFAIDNYLIYNFIISKLLVIFNIDNCSVFDNSIYLC